MGDDRSAARHNYVIPGNHDWLHASRPRQFRGLLHGLPTITSVFADAVRDVRGVVIAGTCGAWPHMNGGGVHGPCHRRETNRLRGALRDAVALRQPDDALIVLTHYPPRSSNNTHTKISRLIENATADLVVYGHLHDPSRWRRTYQQQHRATRYRLVAADYLTLRPRHVADVSGGHTRFL